MRFFLVPTVVVVDETVAGLLAGGVLRADVVATGVGLPKGLSSAADCAGAVAGLVAGVLLGANGLSPASSEGIGLLGVVVACGAFGDACAVACTLTAEPGLRTDCLLLRLPLSRCLF